MMLAFACPHCGRSLNVPEAAIGKKGKCKFCGGSFMVTMLEPVDDDVPAEGKGHFDYDPALESSPDTSEQVRCDLAEFGPQDTTEGLHHAFGELIRDYQKRARRNPAYLPLTVQACLQHIEIAARAAKAVGGATHHRHEGFDVLTELRETQGRYEDVVTLAKQAKTQGWSGDWDRTINRCKTTSLIKHGKSNP